MTQFQQPDLGSPEGGSRQKDSKSARLARGCWLAMVWATILLLCGCATSKPNPGPLARPFDFQKDTFTFANELVWDYSYDTQGHWTTHRREPKPSYYQHCFVVARTAKQFFMNARFEPTASRVDAATYRRLVREVVASNPRRPSASERKVVIPGYADLRAFSADWEQLLKSESGGAWQCYFQRGNWRMIFPISRRQQARTAERLVERVRQNEPVVLHLFRFPQLSINHAVLVFGAEPTADAIRFAIYDPNRPEQPVELIYERGSRTFHLGANSYFPGGRVDAYEVYSTWDY